MKKAHFMRWMRDFEEAKDRLKKADKNMEGVLRMYLSANLNGPFQIWAPSSEEEQMRALTTAVHEVRIAHNAWNFLFLDPEEESFKWGEKWWGQYDASNRQER